jgi:putative membrane protein
MNNYWGLQPFFGIIVWIIFWAIFGLIMSRIGWGRRRWNRDGNKSPMDILKERYAKGEINKQEFEEKKRDLVS